MDLDDYKKLFAPIFADDFNFSRRFKQETDTILARNIAYIVDHELHETESDKTADLKGYDRTIKIPAYSYGVRIRRIQYQHFWQFTVDEQEWQKQTHPYLYIFGYGELDQQQKALPLASYILFNYHKFVELGKNETIKHSIEQNQKHSWVKFLCFSIDAIFQHKLAIDWGGTNPIYFKEQQKQRKLLI